METLLLGDMCGTVLTSSKTRVLYLWLIYLIFESYEVLLIVKYITFDYYDKLTIILHYDFMCVIMKQTIENN